MRFVVALTGASGQIYGFRIVEELSRKGDVYVVFSKNAKIISDLEGLNVNILREFARVYDEFDMTAPISSGSFKHDGMVIAPCSIKTASSIAYGISNNLITRSADVTLKEGRKLILLIRETPLHLGHLKTLLRLAEMGATIMPPVPAFYIKPKSIDEIVNYTVYRVLDLLGVDVDYGRWGGID
ncbi:MAG: aromatic acid decarboxylase [Archaeoglobales archaeon]|nr:MAG: aromatic acid decarboxylase [Archaeoglobales archaeon]